MKTDTTSPVPAIRGGRLSRAFSLIEIIVVVGLLSVITLGLLMMFNQTQRILRSSVTQIDVLESGRTVASMLARELEQVSAAGGTNFYTEILPGNLLLQPLAGSAGAQRTNFLADVFYVSRENQTWVAVGYFVRLEDVNGNLVMPELTPGSLSAGRLYRFEERIPVMGGWPISHLYTNFLGQSALGRPNGTNTSRIIDGVVHFRMRAYDTNGLWMTNGNGQTTLFNTKGALPVSGEPKDAYFIGGTVPASIEFEMGLLENRAWDRYKAIPAAAPAARFQLLTNSTARVHVFRQRVHVRSSGSTSY